LSAHLPDDAEELLPTSAGSRSASTPFEAGSPDALVIQLGTKLRAGVRFFVVE
jgi:hypothetical protein